MSKPLTPCIVKYLKIRRHCLPISQTTAKSYVPLSYTTNGLIYHRPIIDGQKLLADSLGNVVKTTTGAAGEDDAFHCIESI